MPLALEPQPLPYFYRITAIPQHFDKENSTLIDLRYYPTAYTLKIMDVQIINPITYPAWDDILISCPGYSFFHSSAWAKVLYETYSYTPVYFTVADNGQLLAFIPVMEVKSFLTGMRGVSLPFTDYSDAFIDGEIVFKDLFDHITGYGQSHEWKSLELRGGERLPQVGVASSVYCRHVMNLCGTEKEIFSKFRDSTGRNIKKAVKGGVKAEISQTLASVREFDRLNRITRKRHGLPAQPFNFFKKVHEHIISKNLGFVVLAHWEGKVIAGAIYFYLGEKAVFKYGGSERRFHHLRPNNLVMWEAIQWFSQNGYKSICLGRTEPGNEGLRQFKAGWGTEERTEKYYKYNLEKNEFIKESLAIKKIYQNIVRRTPIRLLNVVGSLLYRHVG